MPRCRIVQPEVVRLSISDGDYLDVKKTLNAGEYRDLLAGMALPRHFGEDALIDPAKVGLTKILQYLVGWSLIGLDKQPIPYSPDLSEATRIATLRALDAQTFEEITTAIDAHEAQGERERLARKNGLTSEPVSSATSPSVA